MVTLTLEKILSSIDTKIQQLQDKSISPKVIILSRVPYYTLISHIQKHGETLGLTANWNFHNKSDVTALFYYNKLPLFYDASMNVQTTQVVIEVFGA